MTLQGTSLIGREAVTGNQAAIRAIDPANGEALAPDYLGLDRSAVTRACQLAEEAFATYSETSLDARAAFLEAIASEIEAIGDALIARAMAETGLPRARLEGERGRTCGQLRLFADVVRAGEWLDVRIDPALPDRQPLPRVDLRQRHVALGPVAVFGASNFPLAFSVAGGDTASALAAGCPVVFKAHPAHPHTSFLVGNAIREAARSSDMPDGVFSLLHGKANEVGMGLVNHPLITAIGFTGSFNGGKALFDAANRREKPIPVFAEMGSVNPVFLLPGALKQRSEAIAAGLVSSVTMGTGQFCTNPGLFVTVNRPEA